MHRRKVLTAGLCSVFAPSLANARRNFRLGLTPVFLDNDAIVIDRLRAALSEAVDEPVDLIQRRTYQEITALILDGSVDAAWICGYPYLQHKNNLALLGVPVWRNRPLYQSYLIARTDDHVTSLEDLRGGVHAFSDPDSNSGYLVTASDLARIGETPERFFAKSVFTYGHRNVVRAVAGGLTNSGSVDGYVWEALAQVETSLTAQTMVVAKSEWLGFPPFAARADRMSDPVVQRFGAALRGLDQTEAGRTALQLLFLDRVQLPEAHLYDGIALRMALLAGG